MEQSKKYSILYPAFEGAEYKKLSEITCHDLALDMLCEKASKNQKEFNMIKGILSNMTSSPEVAKFRQEVFSDVLNMPNLRKQMVELFDKFEFIRDYGDNHLRADEKKEIWHLLHRLDELNDYINCVEAIQKCLTQNPIQSDGLKGLKAHVQNLYNDANFGEMKADIEALKLHTTKIKSVTVGINLNDRFEVTELGLVSINNKHFKKSGIISNFADAISSKQKIQDGTDWDGNMHYHPVEVTEETENFILEGLGKMAKLDLATMAGFAGDKVSNDTIVKIAQGDGTATATIYLSHIVNRMLDSLVRRLRDVLNKYTNVVVISISHIIPEFIYYVRMAEFIEKSIAQGYVFNKPSVIDSGNTYMQAKDFYNLKLALSSMDMQDIVTNNLDFDKEHTIYILTGANRGGKTTVTMAIGIMYVLAQGGIFVPASSFSYMPLDCIYTHFPADEDKTMDLGRLGEECVRFRDAYKSATQNSLLLLNESFSTTSFEEGYYIAKDSVKALLKKGVKTIYNTHMHKLGESIEELNCQSTKALASSLVVKSDDGNRSFKIEVAPPEGMSYARDIAQKYGVTYEMLTEE